ncbi:MAG: hypothetical protein JXB13_23025 [Phycisphaerae bacterium]|nr:hypothetical protein [Phycisphaerae bacterium]
MMLRYVILAGLSLALLGCEKRKELPFMPTAPVVLWRDLSGRQANLPQDTFTLLVDEPTEGLFPASLAVARLAGVQPAGAGPRFAADHGLVLSTAPAHELLRWNAAFDDVRLVSEVFPLSQMSLNGRSACVSTLMESAAAMTGRICLVYSITDLTPSESEIKGVLYRVSTQQPVAAVHARGAYYPPPDDEDDEDTRDNFQKLLEPRSARLVAEARFLSLTRACLLALRDNDRPAKPEIEEGWVPQGPLAPPIWPPLYNYWWLTPPTPYSRPPGSSQ